MREEQIWQRSGRNESDGGFPERPGMLLNLNASSRQNRGEKEERKRRGEEGEREG